jgi:hypothetical protein
MQVGKHWIVSIQDDGHRTVWFSHLKRTHAFGCESLVLLRIVGIWREHGYLDLTSGALISTPRAFSLARDWNIDHALHRSVGEHVAGVTANDGEIGIE